MPRGGANFIDLAGRLFTRLLVKRRVSGHGSRVYWECECQCAGKTIVTVSAKNLRNGNTGSCGCIKRERAEDVLGQRFAKLVVREKHIDPERRGLWFCQCDCGKTSIAAASDLRRGLVVSCGCHRRQKTIERLTRHGQAIGGKKNSPQSYRAWLSMMDRCARPNPVSRKYYFDKGITVCERWQTYENFRDDMGEPSFPRATIGRPNPNEIYKPGNGEWQTYGQQAKDWAKLAPHELTQIRWLRFDAGFSVKQIAEAFGVSVGTVNQRLRQDYKYMG